jgi:hypothetical protein
MSGILKGKIKSEMNPLYVFIIRIFHLFTEAKDVDSVTPLIQTGQLP